MYKLQGKEMDAIRVLFRNAGKLCVFCFVVWLALTISPFQANEHDILKGVGTGLSYIFRASSGWASISFGVIFLLKNLLQNKTAC
jgi:hypothetical protein